MHWHDVPIRMTTAGRNLVPDEHGHPVAAEHDVSDVWHLRVDENDRNCVLSTEAHGIGNHHAELRVIEADGTQWNRAFDWVGEDAEFPLTFIPQSGVIEVDGAVFRFEKGE